MSLIIVQNLSLAFGGKTLLDEASFCINAHDRIGLVGPNGTGKSSLLKLVAKETVPDSGVVAWGKGVRIGYLPQDVLQMPPGTLMDTVLAAVPDRVRLTEHLGEIEAGLERAEDDEERCDYAAQLADVHQALASFEERYGRHQAERILQGLGFAERDFERRVQELSGGWKMRAALAGLLLMGPDLLLLDEPTNHLDIPSLVWFDEFLQRSSTALMLVSHDRDFLNRQINRVLSFEVEGLRGYSGHYDDYRRQRALEEEELAARVKRQTAEREKMEAFIERFRAKATKARQVQSRIKLLEKQELVQTYEARATINFSFPEVERSGREVLRLAGVNKAYGPKIIYRDLSQTVTRSERVAIIGANGAGKTTLLKLIAQETSLDAGEITLGHNVHPAYFAQHHTDLLDRSKSILEEIAALAPQRPQSWVRGVLGAFLFSQDSVDKKIGVLSGGERARVALARLLVLPSNLLLLDEPTNHLDLDSTERLIAALKEYTGTLIFVSHHRSFVNQLATRVWDVRDGQISDWPGNLDDYQYHLSQAARSGSMDSLGQGDCRSDESEPSKRESERERRRREAQDRQALNLVLRPIKQEISEIEARIATLEREQSQIEPQLADPQVYQDFARARQLNESYQAHKAELETLYARWEEAQLKLQELAPSSAQT